MWSIVVILLLYATRGVTQIFEGSATDSGDTVTERFVESSEDAVIISNSERTCVREEFRGDGFRIKGTVYSRLFICPNGLIRFNDDTYQNWPVNYGISGQQEEDPSVSPFWARIDLQSFNTDESRVRYASYHIATQDAKATIVFNKVNSDIAEFTDNGIFSATSVSVVTYEEIRPHNRVQDSFEGKNTFQVVFVSNDTSWYLMYNYADIDWAVGIPRAQYGQFVGEPGHPVAGWNAGRIGFDYRNGEEYENLQGSGSVNAEDLDDFEGNFKRGRWIFAISPSAVKSPRVQCFEWSSNAVTLPARRILQCPRFSEQASFDRRFRQKDAFDTLCYVRIFPVGGTGLRCCYNSGGSGELLVNPPTPGGILSRNPTYFSVSDDDGAYENCCILSDLCTAYYDKRPKQNGELYRPRRRAFGLGDPHLNNLDNMNYTFNGCGDYMFVTSTDQKFQVQVTFSQAIGAGQGTVMSAVVVKQAGFVPIQINHNNNDNGGTPLLLNVNGTAYGVAEYQNLTDMPAIIGDGIIIGEGIIIDRQGDSLRILTPDEHSIVVTREQSNLVLVLALDFSIFGMTTGLVGNWSNTIEDDFLLPNGTILPSNITDQQIHFDFGESWRLTSEQNLILDTTADANFVCPSNYTPIFISNLVFPNTSFELTAQSICGGNINCLFDIAATLDPSFGQVTLDTSNRVENEIEMAENNGPRFDMDNVVFNLTIGELFEYTITATDLDDDALQFTTINKPPGANVVQNGNTITFHWLVNSTQAFNLSFLVQDGKNASSALVPVITVCACENNGRCFKEPTSEEQNGLIFVRHEVFSCACLVGFTGEFCETIRDFCQVQSGSPCHPLSNCTNSLTDYICGGCPFGFSGNGVDCSDINECGANTDGCEQLCVNTAGSFECQCSSGFRLNDDMKNCDDINECTTGHDCQQTCVNTEGSFNCACTGNFEVDPNNNKNCVPQEACTSDENDCLQVCAIVPASFPPQKVCSCDPGYTLDPTNATNCVDVNECEGPRNLCNQKCTNTPGKFTCSCLEGYDLGDDSFTCEDVNECVNAGMLVCDSSNTGQICVNLPGTFRCECNVNQGLVLINGTCQVPDPNRPPDGPTEPPPTTPANRNNSVQLRLANFREVQYLLRTDIAFRSSIAAALNSYCNADELRRVECRLPGNGFLFSESNIFRVRNGTIENGDDLLVSFYAIYPDGIFENEGGTVPRSVLLNALNQRLDAIVASTGVTTTIVDVNECEGPRNPCNQKCTNTPGSFTCSCLEGYDLGDDSLTCEDVNECVNAGMLVCDSSNTGQICVNLPGTFRCECNVNQGLVLINGTCEDVDECQEEEPKNCSLFCQNTPGSFVCSCLSGQKLAANMVTCEDFDECAAQTDNCNGVGEICRNFERNFTCECNKALDLGRIDGTCQVLSGTREPPPVPRDATAGQNASAVEFFIPDFPPEQYERETDTQFRGAIAAALTKYCNQNAERRSECRVPATGDFVFSEQDIHRLTSDPAQDGSDTSVSFYALYPNGLLTGTDIPVDRAVLLNAITEELDDIRNATGLSSLSLTKQPPSVVDEDIDWPLALGIALAAALFLLLGIALACMCFGAKAKTRPKRRPLRYVYDAYNHRPRRQMNIGDLDPDFGTMASMSGGTYSGFDEDGLPVDIETVHDGLSHAARTASHMPTGSRASIR